MPSPILARADALMQRRRQGAVPLDDVPVLTDAIESDEDLPILAPEDSSAATPVEDLPPAARAALAEELSRRVQEKLLAEIPHLVHVAVSELLAEFQHKAEHKAAQDTER